MLIPFTASSGTKASVASFANFTLIVFVPSTILFVKSTSILFPLLTVPTVNVVPFIVTVTRAVPTLE